MVNCVLVDSFEIDADYLSTVYVWMHLDSADRPVYFQTKQRVLNEDNCALNI